MTPEEFKQLQRLEAKARFWGLAQYPMFLGAIAMIIAGSLFHGWVLVMCIAIAVLLYGGSVVSLMLWRRSHIGHLELTTAITIREVRKTITGQ